MSIVPIFKRRIFTRKVIYRLFQLNVWTFQKCSRMSTPRLSRRLPAVRLGYVTKKMHWPRQGLERRRIGTRQGSAHKAEEFVGFRTLFSHLFVLAKIAWHPHTGQGLSLYRKIPKVEFDCRRTSVIVHRSASDKLAVESIPPKKLYKCLCINSYTSLIT